MTIPLPKGEYIKNIEINDENINISFGEKKKIALLFISLNEPYWPYFRQVVEDCRINFLPHHTVDYFVWSDMESAPEGVTVIPTDPISWPTPTLMRYHLFLNEEQKLKEYDYIFYLDADMRVVQKISDEILGEQLTAAPHPGYELNNRLIPPYEPNSESEAYIHRLGRVVDDNGKPRFKPFYAAGGFQGGKAAHFIKAMKVMKGKIDKDFNKNYTAIWNDESHWNKYLWDFQKEGGKITFLDVSYIYPDSLINEYYIPMWGRSYEPKIITLTKPFTLSKEAGAELREHLGGEKFFRCPTCNDIIQHEGHKILKVITCPGSQQAHQVDMVPL